jgi:putative NADH-flavin reductase
MRTVALFGITGKTGAILVKKLLAKNYKVKALVRNPLKVVLSSPDLTIVHGNILNFNQVQETIRGADAVINVIGHVKNCPADLQTAASKMIIQIMEELKIKRLINLTGGGVHVEGDNPDLIDRTVMFIMKNLIGKAMKDRMNDGEQHVSLIRDSDLEWTIVRAPVLLPKPAKGKVKTGMVGHISGHSLTFEDLCNEIVHILEEDLYIRQFPYITNG